MRRDDAAPRQDAAATMLALQQSAGNQAVGALLARAPDGEPGKTERPEGTAQVTLGGIGTIQVQSVQLPASTGGAGSGSGGRRREKPAGGQLTFTSRVGPHSSALVRASAEGKGMNGRVDFPGGLHLELSNALVSSYQVSKADDGDTETWTIEVESIEFVTRQPEEPHAERQEQGR